MLRRNLHESHGGVGGRCVAVMPRVSGDRWPMCLGRSVPCFGDRVPFGGCVGGRWVAPSGGVPCAWSLRSVADVHWPMCPMWLERSDRVQSAASSAHEAAATESRAQRAQRTKPQRPSPERSELSARSRSDRVQSAASSGLEVDSGVRTDELADTPFRTEMCRGCVWGGGPRGGIRGVADVRPRHHSQGGGRWSDCTRGLNAPAGPDGPPP